MECYRKDVILMRTEKFETRLQLNSNVENYDIGWKKYLKSEDVTAKKLVVWNILKTLES